MSVTIYLVPDDSQLPSNQPTDAEIAATAAALTAWITSDVGPAWGQDWQGHYSVLGLKRGAPVPAASPRVWLCHLTAESALSGALGYHERDANGNPVLYVAVQAATMAGRPWSLVASHEVAETLVNRFVDAGILAAYQGGEGFFLMEACDPVEGQPAYMYHHNGVDYTMSNFCRPAYFVPGAPGPYDWRGILTAPLTPAAGGQQAVFLVNNVATISPDSAPGVHAGNRVGPS